ncbi:LCP family protein [Aneurinibacillus aneurinilyticus]|uniref:LCP family protein n=1 Tax=Aneurinibacillus aneurinilyticus TaxID=1391 RepID=UPI002E21194B|nr:LCP family protein [Aneurinibacillus aneurinilyticus]
MSEELSRQASRAKKSGRKTNRKRKWIIILAVILFIVGGPVTFAYLKTQDVFNKIHSKAEPSSSKAGVAKAETTYMADKPISLVLLGLDGRGQYGGNLTDVMLIMTLNPKTKKVTMLSIPRDTRAVIPGETNDQKINFVYKRGEMLREKAEQNGEEPEETGPSLVKKTLQSIYGIPVDNYITIDFEGFRQGIDALGGVEINVDRKLVYNDPTDGTSINLNPGLQTLNGKQALDFVRHRHDDRGLKYYSTDYERNDRQVAVIEAAMEKMKSFAGLASFFKVMDAVGENVKTDLSLEQMKALAMTFGKLDGSAVVKLENTGAYWDADTSRTLIPQETMDKNRLALQESIGLDASTVTGYNDSPSGGRSHAKKAPDSTDTEDKKERHKTTNKVEKGESSKSVKKETRHTDEEEPKKSVKKKKSEEEKTEEKNTNEKNINERKSSSDKKSTNKKDSELLDPDKPVSESVSTGEKESSRTIAPTPPESPKAPESPKTPSTRVETDNK